MKENIIKNRKWVIKCAVIFFVILLLLTFFSNTIMNYSLPQVATRYIEPGTIASKVRGSGTVTAAEPYQVTVNSERKVKLIAVKEGDTVEKGSLLVMLEDSEDSEVSIAKQTLQSAKDTYEQYLLTNNISEDMRKKIENGSSIDYEQYKSQLSSAGNVVTEAQKKVDELTASSTSLQTQITTLENTYIDTSAEEAAVNQASAALKTVENELNIAQNQVSSLEERYNLYAESGVDTSGIASELADAKDRLTTIQNKQTQCQYNLDTAQDALTAKQSNTQNQSAIVAAQARLNTINAQLTEATDTLTKAQDNRQKILDQMNQESELAGLYQSIVDAQSSLDKLNAQGSGNKITAEASGTVRNISIAKGQTTVPGEALMTITNEESGYTSTITVTPEQASRVRTGDEVNIDESWYYPDLQGTVSAIRNDSTNPGRSKLIDIKLSGNVDEGTTLNFAIGNKNSSYDMIVPNGSIREDKNGKFILIIREKSSPLGNRYFAKRVDIEVISSDDVNSAITGSLDGYEYVITTSTKSIQPGDQVRLTES